ncbi:hypothetical protein ACP70R_018138 [Stipagrostis hirtigluma subsp. patula]
MEKLVWDSTQWFSAGATRTDLTHLRRQGFTCRDCWISKLDGLRVLPHKSLARLRCTGEFSKLNQITRNQSAFFKMSGRFFSESWAELDRPSSKVRTLWIGALLYWMDEDYIYNCFVSTVEVSDRSRDIATKSFSVGNDDW